MPSVQASLWNLVSRNLIKPSLSGLDPVRALRDLSSRMDRLSPAPRGAKVTAAPLQHCDADWVVPRGFATSDRTVLYVPGGGFSSRAPRGTRNLVTRIARAAGARALAVFYRLAPEHPYPSGLLDVLEAYERLLSDGLPPERIVIGGDSAGGALVFAALQVMRDDRRPLPAGAFSLSAITDLTDHERGSRRYNASRDPMLSGLAHGSADTRMLYVGGNAALLKDPYVSPVFGDFTGLPPLLLQAGSTEVLRDDSVRLAQRARAYGVRAEVEVWGDLPHVWHGWPMPEAEQAVEHLGDFVRTCCP